MISSNIVLFDFDGTLVNSAESLLPVFLAGFSAINRSCSAEDVSKYMHHSLGETIEMTGIAKEEEDIFVKRIIEALDEPESVNLIKPFEETFETLKKLKEAGKRIGIVTNNTEKHVRLVLAKLSFPNVFDVIVGSESLHYFKPHPEPVLIACERFGVSPSEDVVYIGDSLQDVECGTSAGCRGILVDREWQYNDFARERIDSLGQLINSCH